MPGLAKEETELSLINRALSQLDAAPIGAEEWALDENDMEISKQCKEAKKHYSLALRECLTKFNWTFAMKTSLLGQEYTPNPEFDPDQPVGPNNPENIPYDPKQDGQPAYKYKFVLPANIVMIRRFRDVNGSNIGISWSESMLHRTGHEHRQECKIMDDAVYSNIKEIICEYTFYQDDIGRWSAPFTRALCHLLAADMSRELSSSDGTARVELAQYNMEMDEAIKMDERLKGTIFIK